MNTSSTNKRKDTTDGSGNQQQQQHHNHDKKVRFKEDDNVHSGTNTNRHNNEVIGVSSLINDRDILEQINRGNQKQKERDDESLRRKKLFNDMVSLTGVGNQDVDDNTGTITNVEGEEEENDYDDMDMSTQENQRKTNNYNSFNKKSSYNNNSKREKNEDSDDSDDEVGIMPFNLNSDREEGRFKDDGTYERSEENKEEDAWLREYDQVWSNKMPKLTKEEIKRRDGEIDSDDEDMWEKEEEEEKMKKRRGPSVEEKVTKKTYLSNVVDLLENGETVTSALRRLGANVSKKPVIKKKQQQSKNNNNTDNNTTIDPIEQEKKLKQFTLLTESVDYLLSNGYLNIYQDKKEQVEQYLMKETSGGQRKQAAQPNPNNKQNSKWEYKLENGNIYGPFDVSEMKAWKDGGFFTGQNVLCRKASSQDQFKLVDDINF